VEKQLTSGSQIMHLVFSMKIIKTDTLEKQNSFQQNSYFSRGDPPSACKYESQQLTLTKNTKIKNTGRI